MMGRPPVPVGTKRFVSLKGGEPKQWIVKISEERQTPNAYLQASGTWRRLSVIVLEETYGPLNDLTTYVRFRDGNHANCNPSNLILIEPKDALKMCRGCGKKSLKRKGEFCIDCKPNVSTLKCRICKKNLGYGLYKNSNKRRTCLCRKCFHLMANTFGREYVLDHFKLKENYNVQKLERRTSRDTGTSKQRKRIPV